jgi:hypothetical protein
VFKLCVKRRGSGDQPQKCGNPGAFAFHHLSSS